MHMLNVKPTLKASDGSRYEKTCLLMSRRRRWRQTKAAQIMASHVRVADDRMSLMCFCVSESEVTVRSSDLQPCEGEKKVCVTNPRDCDPRPPSSVQSEF